MNILVCEDSRLIYNVNYNIRLIKLLEQRGHDVKLYEARAAGGSEVKDPVNAAEMLMAIVSNWTVEGIILDLNFHGDFNAGFTILATLNSKGILPRINPSYRVCYSKFENDPDGNYHHRLVNDYGFQPDRIFNRLRRKVEDIADLF